MNTLAAFPILLFSLNKNQKYVSLFLYCTSGHYEKVLYNCFCFYVMEYRKQNNIFCTSESLCLKMCSFTYFKNIFYHVTLENVLRILCNSVYFQNIVVCNEPLTNLSPFYYLKCSSN